MKLLFLILTIFIVNAWCKQNKPGVIISDEACPNPLPKVNEFDAEQVAGDWFIIKAYPSVFFQGLSCLRENNIATGPSTYNHTFCENYEGAEQCMQLEANHVDGDGKVSFSFGGVNALAYYLDIDYENYHIIYTCDNLPDGKSQRSLFINSRNPTLSEELLDEAKQKIREAGFDVSPLRNIRQDEEYCGRP